MDSVIYYHEIFKSIQGESTDVGKPCVFVRLFGCNIKCSYCDQSQCSKDRKKISISNLVNKVAKYGIPNVCITGGEPLTQWNAVYPLVLELCSLGFNVSIETNGTLPIDADPYIRKFKYVMDIKCPSSGVSDRNLYNNLMNLQSKDEVKCVIANRKDYDFAVNALRKYPTLATVLFSPCFDENNKPIVGNELVDWILNDRLYNSRVQIQMHKILAVR